MNVCGCTIGPPPYPQRCMGCGASSPPPAPTYMQQWPWHFPPQVEPAAQHFGIIDPDYARIFTQARVIAWQHGWACLVHGSFTRDLDLLLVPWAERGQFDDANAIVHRIADAAGLKVNGEPSAKPHGRRAWTLLLPGFTDPRWVDVSAFDAQATQHAGEQQ